MKKRFLSFVLALIISLSFVSNAFAISYHENDIEKYILGQLSNAKIPGGEVSIVTSGKEVYSASLGDVPETDSDLRIGALSRIFTSISILQLADSKKLTLDTNIADIISGSDNADEITVEDLLKQTSGYTTTQKINSDSIPKPIGKKGEYKDARINYAILGKIVEEVSGVSYSDYIKKNIIEPLQLNSTYTTEEMSGKDIVGGHDNLFGLPIAKKAERADDTEWDAVSATGIISDAKDMGNVLSMFLAAGGKTLSYDQIERVYSDGTDCGNTIFDTKGTSGLGWIKTKVGKQDVYYVSGAIDGYISSAFLVPGQDLGITMLFDTSDVISGNTVIQELMSNVVRLAIGEKARTIDSKAVMLPHIEFDIAYAVVFLASLVPMLLMSWWYRATRKKGIGVVRTIVDVVVHIGLPAAIYKCVPIIIESVLGDSLGSWFMIKKFLPECYYITLLIVAILVIGIPIKIIAAIVAIKKGPYDEEEEDDLPFAEKEENGADDKEESDKKCESDEACEKDSEEAEKRSDEVPDSAEKAEEKKRSENTADDENNLEEEISESAAEADSTEVGEDDAVKEAAATIEENTGETEENVDVSSVDHKENIKTQDKEKEAEEEKQDDAESQEIVKEFKTRKKQNKEEYGSSFEREAVRALENNATGDDQGDIDGDLSDIKSGSEMQTVVPKIKKRYHHQKGMPVKIVVEPDDDLDN